MKIKNIGRRSMVVVAAVSALLLMQTCIAWAEPNAEVTLRVMCMSEDDEGNLKDISEAIGWGRVDVYISNEDTGATYSGTSDSDGTVTVSLPAGTYTWRCDSDRYGYYTYMTADGREEMIMNSAVDQEERRFTVAVSSDGSSITKGRTSIYIMFPSLAYLDENPQVWDLIDSMSPHDEPAADGEHDTGNEDGERLFSDEDVSEFLYNILPLLLMVVIMIFVAVVNQKIRDKKVDTFNERAKAGDRAGMQKYVVTRDERTYAPPQGRGARTGIFGKKNTKYVDTSGYRGGFDVDGRKRHFDGFDR